MTFFNLNRKRNSDSVCILLVDDDEDWLDLMTIVFKRLGLNPITSINGVDIWDKINECHPKVILLDIHMDGVDGEKFCELLKTNPATSDIPVLMYSSNQNIHEVSERCGANGYIEKSLPPSKVKEKLMQFV